MARINEFMFPVPKKYRMFSYLIFSAILYGLAMIVTQPQLQIVLWKAGHITIGAFIGYWIDRAVFHDIRIRADSPPLEQLRRAIIVAAAMWSAAAGL